MVEYCCGPDSLLGKFAGDCDVLRLTKAEDMKEPENLRTVQSWCRGKHKEGVPGIIWCSIPCVGGSARNDMNPVRHTGKFKRRLRMHIREYSSLWKNFETLAREVTGWGWSVAIEWPASCRYWRRKEVAKLQKDLDLRTAQCRGCAMGLVDDANLPIAKPWHISINDPIIWQAMDAQKCPRQGRSSQAL